MQRLSEDFEKLLGAEYIKYFQGSIPFLGFHADYYLIRSIFSSLEGADAFIETGTSGADSLRQVARFFPNLPCFSCESLERACEVARQAAAGHDNVHIFCEPSPDFLYNQVKRQPDITQKRVVFWLDAHSNDFPCPLREEVAWATSEFRQSAVYIDDFQVPGRNDFGYDEYPDGTTLTFDYVEPHLARGRAYRVIRPAYSRKTSLHAPLRGWILLAQGEWSPIPEGLGDLYDVTELRT